jgi:hypothetical protein
MEKRTISEYQLSVRGVFGRNRTPKVHSVTLCETDPGAPVPSDLLAQVGEALRDLRPKPGLKWAVQCIPVEIDGPVRIYMLSVFSKPAVLTGTV